jgi:hypothetical protein
LHQELAQRFERFVESHYPYHSFVEPSGIDAQQSSRFFQKGGLELETRDQPFDLLPLALEGPARGNKQRGGFGEVSVLGAFGLGSRWFFQTGPVAKAKMIKPVRYIQLPDSGQFAHQYPQAPKLHTIARLPYGARHGICTDDASVPGGHPSRLNYLRSDFSLLLYAERKGHDIQLENDSCCRCGPSTSELPASTKTPVSAGVNTPMASRSAAFLARQQKLDELPKANYPMRSRPLVMVTGKA